MSTKQNLCRHVVFSHNWFVDDSTIKFQMGYQQACITSNVTQFILHVNRCYKSTFKWRLDTFVIKKNSAVRFSYMAMRFELATRSVTAPDSENCAPLELQDSLTWKILALPYQKYTFSERKFHEEFKYGIQYDIGSGTKMLWLKIFGFWGPKKMNFCKVHISPPFNPISNSTAYLNSS